MIEIPEAFVRGTLDREGERGAQWLAALPDLVTTLFERWGCLCDGPAMHGEIGIIIPVLHDQRPAVVKISVPHPGNVREPDAYEAWKGRGAVHLYERADECFAMLLERAGSRTLAELHDKDEVVRIAGQINKRLAIPAPPGLPRLRDRMAQSEESLHQDAGDFAHALPRPVVDKAIATARELGSDQPDLVIHGDLHARNILNSEREPWLAVDPKGLVGDPAYDGGTFLKTHAFALLQEDEPDRAVVRCLQMFADAAELDAEHVRRWAQFHAVESAFWRRRHRFPRARGSASPDLLTQLADHLAQVLA
ncbi:aminoglycoside phosphotransferase family protein [Actinospica sp.]|uniref:aminoglycoside phosphotransferase family protein n=1 Tax=Actinospica sp. TaxID=1872142 RepID=UPI002C6101AC|nr:aminoglycoside phosphotransferase family protein [Actinospica sp.]HWG25034.1 aminoglycoside phosphotransferase family protein [Actinospica sp.]